MRLNGSFAIVDEEGQMTDAFRRWTQTVDLSAPLVGSGSPEGVVTARQYQSYINSAGTTGSILYIKMLPSIAGDTSQGWVAV